MSDYQPFAVVGVNNGTMTTGTRPRPVIISTHVPNVTKGGVPMRQVVVTPLGTSSSNVTEEKTPKSTIDKLLLKAITKGIPKNPKTFTLRNIDTRKIASTNDLKKIIKAQFSDDVVNCDDFDVGYISGINANVVTIRSREDLTEVWREVYKGSKIMLWCDGLKGAGKSRKRKKKITSDSESEDDCPKITVKQEREEKVEKCVNTLKEKHGTTFSQMQYRIWAEMVANQMHSNTDTPPSSSMFKRAGDGGGNSGKRSDSTGITKALTEFATSIGAVLATPQEACVSPLKKIESRSKCYKQISDLNNLKVQGFITDEEFASEKQSIMTLLKRLN